MAPRGSGSTGRPSRSPRPRRRAAGPPSAFRAEPPLTELRRSPEWREGFRARLRTILTEDFGGSQARMTRAVGLERGGTVSTWFGPDRSASLPGPMLVVALLQTEECRRKGRTADWLLGLQADETPRWVEAEPQEQIKSLQFSVERMLSGRLKDLGYSAGEAIEIVEEQAPYFTTILAAHLLPGAMARALGVDLASEPVVKRLMDRQPD